MKRHCNYLEPAGFWTAYVRKAGDNVTSPTQFEDEYVNIYTEEVMDVSYWRQSQPSNESEGIISSIRVQTKAPHSKALIFDSHKQASQKCTSAMLVTTFWVDFSK